MAIRQPPAIAESSFLYCGRPTVRSHDASHVVERCFSITFPRSLPQVCGSGAVAHSPQAASAFRSSGITVTQMAVLSYQRQIVVLLGERLMLWLMSLLVSASKTESQFACVHSCDESLACESTCTRTTDLVPRTGLAKTRNCHWHLFPLSRSGCCHSPCHIAHAICHQKPRLNIAPGALGKPWLSGSSERRNRAVLRFVSLRLEHPGHWHAGWLWRNRSPT